MDNILKLHTEISNLYNKQNSSPLAKIEELVILCLEKLGSEAEILNQGKVNRKEYFVFSGNNQFSRPVLKENLILNVSDFSYHWNLLNQSVMSLESQAVLDKTLYTAIAVFSSSIDLWKTTSRKTPGTFFEILLGSIIQTVIPEYKRTKHITIPGSSEKVSTDIVFSLPNKPGGIVIPAKITTRERIVQPYAHQRILDSVFGEGVYKSILVCVSETQRDQRNGVNEICVPGTIRLFQEHLASINAICYLDPPERYLKSDVTSVVQVSSLGWMLTQYLPELVKLEEVQIKS